MTFDEWYATYQADPATDGRPEPTARAAYEAGAAFGSYRPLPSSMLKLLEEGK